MPLQIAILEDDPRRRLEMDRLLSDRLWMYDVIFFDMPAHMNRWLERHAGDCLIICLDHDMNRVTESLVLPGDRYEVGTGEDVAKYLSTVDPACPVIIHTTNEAGATAMRDALEASEWCTRSVNPYGDLEWIGAQWIPAIMQSLRDRSPIISSNSNASASAAT